MFLGDITCGLTTSRNEEGVYQADVTMAVSSSSRASLFHSGSCFDIYRIIKWSCLINI